MKYIIGILVIWVLFPGCELSNNTQYQRLHYTAYMHPDVLADKIINEDPEVMIVDLRSEDAFHEFAIPNAINFPLDKWLERQGEIESEMRGQQGVVLVDDHGEAARFASLYLQEKDICDPYILEGGIDHFVRTIFMQKDENAALIDDTTLEKLSFRDAAAMYFVGMSRPIEPQPYVQPGQIHKKVVKVAPKKKIQEDEEEGC